jgi:hypothetical protein
MFGILTTEGIGLFEFLDRIRSNDGLPALVLFTVLVFVCHTFSRLLWKVWRMALKGKDQEIARLTKERDRYQAVVFEHLIYLDDDLVILTNKEFPDDEGGGGNSSQDKVH